MRNKFLLIIAILITVVGWFYWYGYRPSQIRQECSWVKKHQDVSPAIPAKTEKELIESGIITKDCTDRPLPVSPGILKSLTFLENRQKILCSNRQKVIEEYKNPRPEISAKDWLEKATIEEYQFCLHSKGL